MALPLLLILAASAAPLAAAQDLALYGSGADTGYAATWQLIDMFTSRAKPRVYMSYRWTTAEIGYTEFLGDAANNYSTPYNHFAMSDMPLNKSMYTTLQQAGGVLQIPVVLTKVAIYAQVPNATNNTVILNSCTLAKIFTRQITTWDHPDIAAQNPQLKVPAAQPIVVWRLMLTNAWTYALSTYLSKTCPTVWTYGVVNDLPAWPADIKTWQANQNMREFLDALKAGYTISWLDSQFGAYGNLTEVTITNLYGSQLQSTQANSTQMATALQVGQYPALDADWSGQPFINVPSPSSWPMTLVNYLLVRKDSRFLGASGGVLRAYAQYLLSDEAQAAMTAPRGSTWLPTSVALSREVRADLLRQLNTSGMLTTADSAAMWMFEDANSMLPIAGNADYVVSSRRDTYATLEINRLAMHVRNLEVLVNGIMYNETQAALFRAMLYDITQTNAATAAKASKANEIAVAGVVISVLLAVVAIILAAVYVTKTKKLDQKYAKYLPLGVKARFGQGESEGF